jgi:hypothetical protein
VDVVSTRRPYGKLATKEKKFFSTTEVEISTPSGDLISIENLNFLGPTSRALISSSSLMK